MPSIGRGVNDLGYAVRTLGRNPAFSGAVIATLAIAIGANVAIFAIVNALVFRPLPYPEVERLVAVSSTPKGAVRRLGASYADYDDWRTRARAFEAIGLAGGRSFTLSGGEAAQVVDGARCTANLFRVIRIRPIVGRVFGEREDRPGADAVVLLSQGLWEGTFNADRSIVGRVLRLDGRDAVVLGVMPRDFAFPDHAQLWVPMAGEALREDRSARGYSVLARLRPATSVDDAAAEMRQIGAALAREHPVTNGEVGTLVASLAGARGPRALLLAFMVALGAGGFVLLIACANVTSLFLARLASREREFAIRLALGATRLKIARLLMAEAVVLTLPAGVLGLLIGQAGRDAMIAMVPSGIPTWMRFDTDWRILAFTAATTMAAALGLALSPGCRASRRDTVDALRESPGTGQARGLRLRSALVVVEIALTLVLLVGAGLMLQTFFNATLVDPGLRPAGLLTLRLTLPESHPPGRRAAVFESIASRVAGLPGVAGVGLASSLPLAAEGRGAAYETQDTEPGRTTRFALRSAVSEAYMRTAGVPVVAGRSFDTRDGSTALQVAIVSRALAEHEWPHQDPVGKRLRFAASGTTSPWLTVVGVAGDIRYWRLEVEGLPCVYVPLAQSAPRAVSLVARGAGDLTVLAGLVRTEVARIDRDVAIADLLSFEAVIRRSLWAERLFMRLFEVFGLVALGLAVVGVYGVVSYSVERRTREIGIRAALGAGPRSLGWLILRDAGRLALLGIAFGLGGAYGASGAMSRLLYGVTPRDAATFGVVSLLLLMVTCVAAYVPVRRAARLDPLAALRRE